MVEECEWCEGRQANSERREEKQPEQPVREIAGVGKRPVSKQHMPNCVSEADDKQNGEEAGKQSETEKGFGRNKVREKLAVAWSGLRRHSESNKRAASDSTCRRHGEAEGRESSKAAEGGCSGSTGERHTEKWWQYGCHASRFIRPGCP